MDYLTVSVDQESSTFSPKSFTHSLTRLQSRCWLPLSSSGESIRERSASKFPQVVGRIPFLMAVGFNAACFFKASSAVSGVCVCVCISTVLFFFFFKSFHLIQSSTPKIISPIINSESFVWASYPLGWLLLKKKKRKGKHQKIMC